MPCTPTPDVDETSVCSTTSNDTSLSSRADDETYMDYTFYSGRSLRMGKERNSLLLRQQQQALLPKQQQGYFGFRMNPMFQQQNDVRAFASRGRRNSFSTLPLAPPASPFGSSSSLSSLVAPVPSSSPASARRQLTWTAGSDGENYHKSVPSSIPALPFSEFSVLSTVDNNDASSYGTVAPSHQELALRQQIRNLRLQLETQKLESSVRQMQYEEQITTLQSTCREQLRMLEVLKGGERDRICEDRILEEHSSHYILRMPSLSSLSTNRSVKEDEKKAEDEDEDSYVVEESQYLARKQSSMIDDMQTDLDANDSAMDALLEGIDALQQRQKDFLSSHSRRPAVASGDTVESPSSPAVRPDDSPIQPEEQADGSVLELHKQIATLQREREVYRNRLTREEEKMKVAMDALAVARDRISSFEHIVTAFAG
jgi:hypothetical protein